MLMRKFLRLVSHACNHHKSHQTKQSVSITEIGIVVRFTVVSLYFLFISFSPVLFFI